MATSNTERASGIVITWGPFAVALISCVIAVYTFIVATRPPVAEVILPQQIRIAQGEDFGYAYIYFQSTLVSAGRSQQVEVIRDLKLEFSQAAGSDIASFEWRESGRIVYDPATRQTTYAYEADASPLLLTRETAQSPLATFYGDPGWFFTPGDWRGTLTATRASNQTPLRADFRFTLSEQDVETMNAGGGSVYVQVGIEPAE